jgi:crotonobetainyl-CoA:carnitine CoA-transferase CaiB-like acyl-CoA transferase
MRFLDGWGIVTPTSDHDFAGMCKALDVEGWDDPRIATVGERIKNREVLAPVMDMVYAMAANLTMDEATVRFERERVPFSMILTPEQLTRDPHAVAIGMFVESEHHIVGRTRLPRHPAQFGATPATLTGDSPALGQHTDEILTELGLGDEIATLREKAVVT